jgi:hydroxypyruvate isomerase
MARFAANLSTMYAEHEFSDRFAAAAADGFQAVECQFPYAYPATELRRRLDDHGLQQVLLNAPPGDWDAGERGLAAIPGREREYREGVELALEYAAVLGSPRVHVMAGVVPVEERSRDGERRLALYEANLAWAASRAATSGVDILIEPINGRDMPGYVLGRQDQAHAIVDRVGAANLKVQLDLYHCQISEGDLTMTLRRDLPTGRVGHLQVAGVPDRHEPDEGELNLQHLLATIDALGFDGWVGCEYRPRRGTSEGLGWLRSACA